MIVTAKYVTPTPCYRYHKTEITGNDLIKTLKIFAETYEEPCIQILGSLTRTDTIYFDKAGIKKLRFWMSDSTFKDSTIIYPAHYQIKFPNFFIEKGSNADSSYISLRGTKINSFVYELE